MAEKEDKKTEAPESERISENQRFSYIGFEVFPGKPKDLFKTEAERDKHVAAVRKRIESGNTLRDQNTLLEERISTGERIILALACVIMIGAFFLPWYSAYTETVEESVVEEVPAVADTTAVSLGGDTTAILGGGVIDAPGAADEAAGAATTDGEGTDQAAAQAAPVEDEGPEIIHSGVQRQKVSREHYSVSYFGAFGLLGSAGDVLFGSGIIAVSTILMLVLMVACLILPLYTLFLLFGSKLKGDDLALRLKKGLRLNWLPLVLLFVVMLLSFLGGSYGGSVPYNSLGDSYGIAAFLGALSFGLFVAIAMSVLLAVKGIEI